MCVLQHDDKRNDQPDGCEQQHCEECRSVHDLAGGGNIVAVTDAMLVANGIEGDKAVLHGAAGSERDAQGSCIYTAAGSKVRSGELPAVALENSEALIGVKAEYRCREDILCNLQPSG